MPAPSQPAPSSASTQSPSPRLLRPALLLLLLACVSAPTAATHPHTTASQATVQPPGSVGAVAAAGGAATPSLPSSHACCHASSLVHAGGPGFTSPHASGGAGGHVAGDELVAPADHVWLFGYGAIMHPNKAKNANITVQKRLSAILQKHRVRFNTCMLEENKFAYSNIEASAGHCVHGVAVLVTAADAVVMDGTEEGYEARAVDVATGEGVIVGAKAYFALKNDCKDKAPSERYGSFLYCGAKGLDVCPEYVSALRSFGGTSSEKCSVDKCDQCMVAK